MLVLTPTVAVLAIDDPRLVGMKPKPHLSHPRGDPGKHILSLLFAHAVHDGIVGVALERAVRIVPGHPRIERKMHEQVRQDRRNDCSHAIANFEFDRVAAGCGAPGQATRWRRR